MSLTDGIEIGEEERMTNPIYPTSASSFVLLAYQDRYISEAHSKLRSLKDDLGYNITGHEFRPALDYPRGRSEQLDDSAALLKSTGYLEQGSRIHLTEAGTTLLKRKVLECFVEDPDLTQRLSKDVGFNLSPLLQKCIKEFLVYKTAQLLP